MRSGARVSFSVILRSDSLGSGPRTDVRLHSRL